MIVCPQCHKAMKEISGFSHYGTPVRIDQCPFCRGIWFDQNELWQLSYGSANDIDNHGKSMGGEDARCLEFKAPAQTRNNPHNRSLQCPRCDVPLQKYHSYNFPPDLEVDYCASCHGFWLDEGELIEFKEEIRKKQAESRKRAEDRLAEQMKNRSSQTRRTAYISPLNNYEEYRLAATREEADLIISAVTSLFKFTGKMAKKGKDFIASEFFNKSSPRPSAQKARPATHAPKSECPHCHRYFVRKEDNHCPYCHSALEEKKARECMSGRRIIAVNQAPYNELSSLPMISADLAHRIIEYREHKGLFQKKTDLLRIRGITPQIFSRIKDMISVDQAIPDSAPLPEDTGMGRKLEF